MSDNNTAEYIRCYNCGKHILAADAYKKKYCSIACSSMYEKCVNCGIFYMVKKGYSDKYCTKDCAIDEA